MTTLFGQRIEPDFDLAKEQRGDRVWWVIYGGLALSIVYDFSGGPFSTEVLQGMFATVFPYGISFYVNQKNNQLGRLWLWKAVLASLPVHILYLMGVFWSDKEFPEFMTKVVVFLPVLAVGAAIESIFLFDRIANYFKPRGDSQSTAPLAQK